jgi:hypothetical protein
MRRPIAEILPRTAIRASRKFPVAAKFSFGPSAIARRTVAEILARATWGIGPLLAVAVTRSVRFPVAELAVLESPGRTGFVAVAIVALGARRTIVAIKARAIAARLEIPLLAASAVVPVKPSRPRPVAVIAAGRSIVVPAAWRAVIAAAGIGTLAALALAECALGEFLIRPSRRAGATLAAEGTVTPAAGIVVFVVVAGHERSRFACRTKWQ